MSTLFKTAIEKQFKLVNNRKNVNEFASGTAYIGEIDIAPSKLIAKFGSPMSGDTNMAGTTSMHFLDSPSTTSATTYKVQMTGYNSGVTTYINTNISRGGQIYDDIAASNLTLIEVQG